MRQLQETLTEVQARARRSSAVATDKVQESESTLVDLVRESKTTLRQLLDARTEVVVDTATRPFNDIVNDVKAVVGRQEGLDKKVQGQANEIRWLMQGLPVADNGEIMSDRRPRQEGAHPRPGAH